MDGVTCFECAEHMVNPIEEFEKIFAISKTVLISTILFPEEIPSKDWDYYGFEHGQHISFYSAQTLTLLANYFGVSVVSVGGLHLFSPNPVNRKKMKWLISKADRVPYMLGQKTLFKLVEKKMKAVKG